MGFNEFIEKTLSKRRGYKYHTYETVYDGKTFELYHYGCLILQVDMEKKKITDLYVSSVSDRDAINRALWIMGLGDWRAKLGWGIIREIDDETFECVERFYKYDRNWVSHSLYHKCKKIYQDGRLVLLQNSKRIFLFILEEKVRNRIFWVREDKETEEKSLYDRKFSYICYKKEINLNSLFRYTNNLDKAIEMAKIKAIIDEL